MSVIYSVRGISKRFGVVQALSGVDLDVVQGKVVGLVGANGAGKSTLLKIIAGALPPDSGELRLDGEPLVMTSITHAALAGIAIVSQELSLFPALSVEENLLLAPGGRDWKIPPGVCPSGPRDLCKAWRKCRAQCSVASPGAGGSPADRNRARPSAKSSRSHS